MKAPYKNDILGTKIEWVVKIQPIKEAFFKSTDFKTFAMLPDEAKFKKGSGFFYVICILSLALLLWFGFEFISLFENRSDYNILTVKIITFVTVVILELLLIKFCIDNYKSSPVKLVITKEYFIYNNIKTEWSSVSGIYAIYRKSKTTYLNSLRIKTHSKKIIEIYISDLEIREEYVSNVFSIYKTYYDCNKK